MLTTVDLFSGCGGLSLGFEKAGFNIVAAFENWESAAVCYENNLDHPVIRMNLADVDTAIIKIKTFKPDLIIGGPPCQDFSHAGKRIEAERASLTEDFASIIASIKPQCFVMENVDRAMKSESYNRARRIFVNNGYGLSEIVLDASLCGVPQKRKRFFSIGCLGENDGSLIGLLTKDFSSKPMTVRDYLGDSLGIDYYYRHPRNYNRRGIFSIDEPAPTIRGVNRPIPKGYPGHKTDAGALSENIRSLTTEERALLQTFPNTFKLLGSKTDLEQMIGNAVPVNLAYYVAKCVMRYMNEQ